MRFFSFPGIGPKIFHFSLLQAASSSLIHFF
jgi:hypothetical protein